MSGKKGCAMEHFLPAFGVEAPTFGRMKRTAAGNRLVTISGARAAPTIADPQARIRLRPSRGTRHDLGGMRVP